MKACTLCLLASQATACSLAGLTGGSAPLDGGPPDATKPHPDASGYEAAVDAVPDAHAQASTPPGLVAAYGFSEGTGSMTADSSGYANTGSVVGAAWTASGQFGSALSFDGSTTSVSASSAAWLDLTGAMTVEAWVYPTTAAAEFRAVVAKNYAYFLYASVVGYCGDGTPLAGIQIGASMSSTACLGHALALGTWTHLAATYDGSALTFYENGAPVASTAATAPILSTTGTLEIGGSQFGEHFEGRIDEVRVYSRALTAAEIALDMVTPIPPAPTADAS